MEYRLVVHKSLRIEHVARLATNHLREYTILDRHGALPKPVRDVVQIEAFGGGGFGSVFYATDTIGLKRALKIIPYQSIFTDAPDAHPLRQEIQLTGRHAFKNVLPILAYGEEKDLDGFEFIYYTMPLVEGYTLADFFGRLFDRHRSGLSEPRTRHLLRDILIQVARDIVAGLIELHQSEIVHLDVSASNAMVSIPGLASLDDLAEVARRARGLLIDLGAARQISPDRHGKTPLFYNEHYFPLKMLPSLLADDATKSTSYELLAENGRQIDLFELGRTLEIVMLDRGSTGNPIFATNPKVSDELRTREAQKQQYWEEILRDDFKFIRDLILDLMNIDSPRIRTSERVKELLDTLEPAQGPAVFGSTLLTDKYQPLRIPAGPVVVKLASPASELVGHPAFQRLRRVQQLAFLSEVYSGATHTRFTHALQVFDLTKRYLGALARVADFRREFQRQQVDETLIAALLHDCGQYPFAHTLEDLRKMATAVAGRLTNDPSLSPIQVGERQEKLRTLSDIQHDQDMAAAYLARRESYEGTTRSLNDILASHGIDTDVVGYIIAKTEKDYSRPRYLNIARDIVSGLIDADRVAYLKYDSEQTGVPYGQAVDVALLVDSLTVRTRERDEVGLGIEMKGVPAAEAVIAALYWMYQNVYWHTTNRAFMAAVKSVVTELFMSGETTFDSYAETVYGQTDFFALSWLADR